MVTVIVGRKIEGTQCHVITTAEGVDEPFLVEFPLPMEAQPLKPGKPAWANYVKGVVQHFKGMYEACYNNVKMDLLVHIHDLFRSSLNSSMTGKPARSSTNGIWRDPMIS